MPSQTRLAPRASLRLGRSPAGPREFCPLAPPREATVELEAVDVRLLDGVTLEGVLDVAPGTHAIPLFAEDSVRFDAGEHTHATVVVEAAAREGLGADAAVVTTFSAVFDPPIVIHGILPILAELPGLFQDRTVEAVLRWVARANEARSMGEGLAALRGSLEQLVRRHGAPLRARALRRAPGLARLDSGAARLRDALRSGVAALPRLRDALRAAVTGAPADAAALRDALRTHAGAVAEVELERLRALPRLMGDTWVLEPSFSGRFILLDRMPVEFTDVRLPRAVIPLAHADLSELFSSTPLATATLRDEHLHGVALTEALSKTVTGARGSARLHGRLPAFALELLLPDQGWLNVDASLAGAVRGDVEFSATLGRDEVHLDIGHAALELDEQRFEVGAEAHLTIDAPMSSELGLAARIVKALHRSPAADDDGTLRPAVQRLDRVWREQGIRAEVRATVRPGSRLSSIRAGARVRHAQLHGGTDVSATIRDVTVTGTAEVVLDAQHEVPEPALDLWFSGAVELDEGTRFFDGFVGVDPAGTTFHGTGHVRAAPGVPAALELSGEGELETRLSIPVEAFPELDLDAGELTGSLPAHVRLDVAARVREEAGRISDIDFSTTGATVKLGEGARLVLGRRSLTLPAGAEVSVALREAVIASSGLGRATFDAAWDLFGASPVLSHAGESVEILVQELRRGAFTIELGPEGGLTILQRPAGAGPVEIMDGPLMNALLNPGADPDRLFALLEDDEIMGPVLSSARVFSPGAHRVIERLRDFGTRVRRALDAEGVKRPGDAIPGVKLARILSRFLADTPDYAERLYPLVKQVTDGRGFDLHVAKRLLDDVLGEHDHEFEVDRIVRWVKHLLAPTEPVVPVEPRPLEPLEWTPELSHHLVGLPSARELYRMAGEPGSSRQLARVAPYLTLEQLEHLLAGPRPEWPPEDRGRLLHVRELKRRVRMIEESYGGIAYAPQALAIGFFLGETIALSGAEPATDGPDGLADTLIGPADAAALLQAGLAAVLRGRTVQMNQTMLLEHVLSLPPSYLLGVLFELSRNNARVLAGALNALLNLDQRCVRAPLDLVAELSRRLGVEVPRFDDFQAGGDRANQSYFEALNRTAEFILERAQPYVARRCHLQIDRRLELERRPLVFDVAPGERELQGRARAAIVAADAVGVRCRFEPGAVVPDDHERARDAYREAFRAVSEVLAADRRAFQRPWLKEFWARNHEALMVLSVVRNVEQDVDAVRRWLATRLGRPVPHDTQEVLLGVLDAMYHDPRDRAALAADPLVRLLIDPPAGRYDFTIVTAMGVITDGARGVELEASFQRLSRRRGVRVIRADTANFRSLEYNAARVEEAVRQVTTPWGYIGYSQGCANLLCAESLLLGGTPEQQSSLDGLLARNFLYSAINGSAHGTASDGKFLRAMTEGDRFLKHYQSVLSRRAIEAAAHSLRLFLDSRLFVTGLLGSASLSHEGVAFLHREGQWKSDVPTSIIRGIVEPETLPEALEWLSNVLTVEVESDAHDTQVVATEAVGHPIGIENEAAEVLERCDMGCLVQRTHHWSPLVAETEFIATERDRAQAIYDFPKDRHVFPWVEVNARFGMLPKAPA